MTGARPLAVTDCLNFGNPENPEVMWQFKYSCEGIKDACKALNTPVIGGNVSLYNETSNVGIFPTPAIATVGVNDDMDNVLKSSFDKSGNDIFLLGDTFSEFGGSLYTKVIEDKICGTHPKVDFELELKLWDLVIQANKLHLLESAKDVNIGGIAVALAKMSSVSDLGCDVSIQLKNEMDLFSESLSRAIVEIKPENVKAFSILASEIGISSVCIGQTCQDTLKINSLNKDMNSIKDIYFNSFKKIIEQDN
jgi:phosphoribosylformylglycinamidine synthase